MSFLVNVYFEVDINISLLADDLLRRQIRFVELVDMRVGLQCWWAVEHVAVWVPWRPQLISWEVGFVSLKESLAASEVLGRVVSAVEDSLEVVLGGSSQGLHGISPWDCLIAAGHQLLGHGLPFLDPLLPSVSASLLPGAVPHLFVARDHRVHQREGCCRVCAPMEVVEGAGWDQRRLGRGRRDEMGRTLELPSRKRPPYRPIIAKRPPW